MNTLFTPLTLKNIELKNRIVMAPMCLFTAEGGAVNHFHLNHYATRALGGTAMLIVEATGVLPEGRISDHCLGLWRDDQMHGMRYLAHVIHDNGALAGIQLNHAGRKSEVTEGNGKHLVCPSAIAYDEKLEVPEALDAEGIRNIVAAFRDAAARAAACGFDFIEIHAAHGYLLSQFLSPLVNQRDDAYGADRGLILDEVIAAVRSVWPSEQPLGVRVSAEEYKEGGGTPAYMAELLNGLKQKDEIDLLDVSSGGIWPVVPTAYPGYQTAAAETLRNATGLTVMTGGLLTEAAMMDEIIRNERADAVFVGRELLRNPNAPLYFAHDLDVDVPWPKSYERAKLR